MHPHRRKLNPFKVFRRFFSRSASPLSAPGAAVPDAESVCRQTQFTITQFGAVGDGKTDCTEAIQTALDRAGECRGCVIVPPGVYRTRPLKMRAHTRLEGKAAWSFRTGGLSILQLSDAAPETTCLLDITGAFGSTVSGICMDGQHLGEKIHGIFLHWPQYNGGGQEDTPAIEDCRIGGFTGDGVHLSHIWCFSLRHCMIHGNKGSGLYIDGWDGFLLDNWFTGNTKAGICGGPCVASVTATGNRIEWNSLAGIRIPRGNCINITGNYFDRSFGPSVWLGEESADGNPAFHDAAITGNIFNRGGCTERTVFTSPYQSAHLYLIRTENLAISGNSCRVGQGDNGKGSFSPDYGFVVQSSDALAVQANAMRNGFLKQGIVWDGQGDCLFSGNPGIKNENDFHTPQVLRKI